MANRKANRAEAALAEGAFIGLATAAAMCWMTTPALRMKLSRLRWPARYILVDRRRHRVLTPGEVRALRASRLR